MQLSIFSNLVNQRKVISGEHSFLLSIEKSVGDFRLLLFFKKWRKSVLFVGPSIPLFFFTSGDTYPGFQSQGECFTCLLHCLHAVDSSALPLVRQSCWWPTRSPSTFTCIFAYFVMQHRQCSTCCAQVCELLGDDLTRLSDTKDVFKCLVEVMLLHHH